jgi:hypothetical protein
VPDGGIKAERLVEYLLLVFNRLCQRMVRTTVAETGGGGTGRIGALGRETLHIQDSGCLKTGKGAMRMVTERTPDLPLPPLGLLIEVAPDGTCLGHIPSLPGLCFKADNSHTLHSVAVDKVAEYARWLIYEGLYDFNPLAAKMIHHVRNGRQASIQVIETERRDGTPLWISGNPAVLFEADNRALNDTEIRAHLRFVNRVVKRTRAIVASFTPAQRTAKSAASRRSIDETLAHMGNCIWWYCSRIDDTLPEPDELPDEEPGERIARLLEAASEFLIAVPTDKRPRIHVPQRFPTSDPNEPWNHTKVCRRQAEHAWEHLKCLAREVKISFL